MGFVAVDEMRRWYGRALDLWLARTETPSRVRAGAVGGEAPRLRSRGKSSVPADNSGADQEAIHWDLMPSVSVVLACLQARFRVYILEWTETPPNGSDSGLAVYADELILECAKAVDGPTILAGHSLGGTFATIFAALHPERVHALILLEAPLVFQETPELSPSSFASARPQRAFAKSLTIPAPCSTR